MFENINGLWLVRTHPGGENRFNEFINEGIIAIGWNKIPSLVGKPKDEIFSLLKQHNYGTSNVTIGAINHFVNNMKVGDLCLVPTIDNSIYIAKIESDYYYEETKVVSGYPHQRKATFLKSPIIGRYDLPDDIQKSLGAQSTIANLGHRLEIFKSFINKNETDRKVELIDGCTNPELLQEQIIQLLPKAIANIKNDLQSDDPTRRFNASIEILKLSQNYK